jgi:PERQ amino acid-rich with GYF domain-containing protein
MGKKKMAAICNHEKVNERDSNISRSWNSRYFASRGAGGGTSDHLSPDAQKLSASFGHRSS